MITGREKKILNILVSSYTENILTTGSQLAYELSVTTKTIQHDIRKINKELGASSILIETVSGKGYRLSVTPDSLIELIELIHGEQPEETELFDSQETRLRYIAGYLIFSKKPVLSDHLTDQMYISRSQFSADIRQLKEKLEPYHLNLVSRSKNGISIEGNEYDKRQYLMKEGINHQTFTSTIISHFDRNELSHIVMDAINNEKYKISDSDLQRFIIYLETALVRMIWGASLQEYDGVEQFPDSHEYRIVQEIFDAVTRRFPFDVNEYEIADLASFISTIRIQIDNSYFSEEAEEFVTLLLPILKQQFSLDFSGDMELRLNLAIHFTSLLVRARNHQLAENHLTEGVQQSLTLPYDIATVTVHLLEKHFDIRLSDSETAYIAVYFAMSMNHLKIRKNKKNVLLITSSRRSEEMLLRHSFMSRFADKISSLDIVQSSDLSRLNSYDYDCVFSTTYSGLIDKIKFNIIQINYFLSDKDLFMIEKELNANTGISDLNQYFDERLFFHNPPADTKEDLIRFLCREINEIYHFDNKYHTCLYDNIMARENAAPTVFADSIALPHPEIPFSDSTIAAVAVYNEPICWDSQYIHIIFLMNIKKDGEEEMDALFDFFSEFISNRNMQNRLLSHPAFRTLQELLSSVRQKSGYDL